MGVTVPGTPTVGVGDGVGVAVAVDPAVVVSDGVGVGVVAVPPQAERSKVTITSNEMSPRLPTVHSSAGTGPKRSNAARNPGGNGRQVPPRCVGMAFASAQPSIYRFYQL